MVRGEIKFGEVKEVMKEGEDKGDIVGREIRGRWDGKRGVVKRLGRREIKIGSTRSPFLNVIK